MVSKQASWSFVVIIVGILILISVIIIGRYIYLKLATRSLTEESSDQESQFWNKKALQKYKDHPKLKDAIRQKHTETERRRNKKYLEITKQ